MKGRKIFFFVFLILFSFSFIPTVSAEDDTSYLLGVDLLAINAGDFIDGTPGDTIRSLKSSVGGKDLLAFENLGIQSYDEATNTIIYGGIITFGAEANAYTAVLCEDAYPTSGGTNFNKITEHMFLSYQIWKHKNVLDFSCSNPLAIHLYEYQVIGGKDQFYINYREIEFGQRYSHNYDGVLPLEIDIDPGLFLSNIGELEVDGQKFMVPKITSDIKDVKEVMKRAGEVGGYEDRFTGETEGIDEVIVDIVLPPITWSYNVREITNWFNTKMDPVLDAGGIPPPEICPTIQQSVIDTTLNTYSFAGIQDSIEVPYKVHLQPEMKRIPQTIALKYGRFHWWECCNDYRVDPIIETNYYERNVGMHVSNVFVHVDFEIKVEIAMSCKFDAKLSESFLEDPSLLISDRVWSSSIFGTGRVDLQLPSEEPWWMTPIIIIIILFGLYISIKYIIKPYLEDKKAKKSKRGI